MNTSPRKNQFENQEYLHQKKRLQSNKHATKNHLDNERNIDIYKKNKVLMNNLQMISNGK